MADYSELARILAENYGQEPNRLAGGAAPAGSDFTTADIIDRIPKPGNTLDGRAYLRDRAMRGEISPSDRLNSLLAEPPKSEPNLLGRLLEQVPPEAAFAANFIGPRIGLPPIRAFHGMNGPLKGGKFDPQRYAGQNHPDNTPGVFLTTDPDVASGWAEWARPKGSQMGRNKEGTGTAIVPADVQFRNPLHVETTIDPSFHWFDNRAKLLSAAERGGHDGIVVTGSGRHPSSTLVALRPNTVRSALTGDTLYGAAGPAAASVLSQYLQEPEQ